jgi:hypothetical protein
MPTIVQDGTVQQTESMVLAYSNTPSVKGKDLKASARKGRFQDVFPLLKEELVQSFKESKMPVEATEWFTRVSEFNVAKNMA